MPLQPIWQDLPFEFKRNVVKKLDCKSRISLQKCSKSDQYLVQSVPFFINSILLTISPDDVDQNIRSAKSELMIIEKPLSNSLYWKTDDHNVIIDTLKSLIMNPRANVEEMILNTKKNPAEFMKLILGKSNSLKFQVERLYWANSGKISKTTKEREDCLKFFNSFDTVKLKKLELKIPQKRLMEELMKTDQLKSAKQIFLKSQIENDQLDNVLHAKELRVHHFYEQGIMKHRFDIGDHTAEDGEALIIYLKIDRLSVIGAVCRVDHIHEDSRSIY
ncbi:hypothetical protein CAEBREN_22855 [Caenorhabditis brenneri]|uniref:Uncharacterized protein n=1 Tax=Caenorhabditis brenneri TaxID=135651 RepID=G0N0L1_CAEBE|nr:hypothetical protein CAEBREN_22855 [Caenorhabditis brenneri]